MSIHQKTIQLIECPRDAMQGWGKIISTEQKVAYFNNLLQVGFHALDMGSFVSPKLIPQMADTALVIPQLISTHTKLLVIVANERGMEVACRFPSIHYIGFPFSISPSFQQLNTHSSMEESFVRVQHIQMLCQKTHKELVIYLSMAFGNPYQDSYSPQLLVEWTKKLSAIGISVFSLADTTGLATPMQITTLFNMMHEAFPTLKIGIHLHATKEEVAEKIQAVLATPCMRIDATIKGIGGCPLAQNKLVGNIPMEYVIQYLQSSACSRLSYINTKVLSAAVQMADHIFTH